MYSINYAANDEEQTKASPINTRVNTGVICSNAHFTCALFR